MSDNDVITVDYKRDGTDAHDVFFHSEPLPDMHIDYAGIPTKQRGGTAVKLLCASALYCFASTLGSALVARKANVKSLRGRAFAKKDQDEFFRTKVTEVKIEIEVEIEDEDLPILKKCERILDRGCLVTYSLEDAIEIEHEITRIKP